MKSPFPRYVQLALWLAVYLGVSAVIGQVTRANIAGWYTGLDKPPLNPPNAVFPIVWTTLYVMMAVAGWILTRHKDMPAGRICLILFGAQTLVNWIWSFIFFEWHMLGLAFAWILGLIALVAVLILKVSTVSRTVMILLLPYLVWIAFASYLSGAIWLLN